MELKMAFHSVNGRRMVEVFDNSGALVAGIYPDETSNGIRIISKYIATFDIEKDTESSEPLPAFTIKFLRAHER